MAIIDIDGAAGTFGNSHACSATPAWTTHGVVAWLRVDGAVLVESYVRYERARPSGAVPHGTGGVAQAASGELSRQRTSGRAVMP
jgi:hypothetical protein